MYTPRGRARAARPPASPGGSPRPPASAAWRGARPWRSGGVGISSSCQLLDQPLDPRRVGLGVDAVDRRHPLALQQLRDLLVGEDHQPLDQAVRLGLGDAARAADVAGRVEAELRLEGLDVEAGRAAPLAQRRRRLARHRQRLGDRLRRFGAAGEDRVELVVVEPRVGADAAAVEARRGRPAARSQLDLRGHREALDARRQAARLLAQRVRQHRLDRARRVGAVAAAPRLAVERRAGRHVGGDVGDVDPEPQRRLPRAAPRPRRRSRAPSPGRP